jgi:ribosome-binding factor A
MPRHLEASFDHVRDTMAQIFARDIEFPRGCLVTVQKAKLTANTAHANITLSVLPRSSEPEVRHILERSDGIIKDGLAHGLRLRRIPRLHYSFDEIEAHAEEIELLLNKIKE